MEYVTTTGLRTQSPQLIRMLKKGESVSLVHRSQVIGTIAPDTANAPVATEENLLALLQAFKPKKLVPKNQRVSLYRANLKKKYG